MVGEVEIMKRAQMLMFQPLCVYILVFLTIYIHMLYVTVVTLYTIHEIFCNKI